MLVITYRGMTFCSLDCANVGCPRNKAHVPTEGLELPVAWAEFVDCPAYAPGRRRESRVCATCDGTGRVYAGRKCGQCLGTGHVIALAPEDR